MNVRRSAGLRLSALAYGRTALGIVATTLLVFAIDLFVSVINPFGMDDAVKARAGDVLQRIASHAYGATQATEGQRAVSVVVIDEPFLRIQAGSAAPAAAVWPMPVQDLTGLIHRIVRARPAAVFVDLAFPDAPREVVAGGANSRQEALAQLGRNLRALDPDVPIFIAEDLVPKGRQASGSAACAVDYIPSEALAGALLNAQGLRSALYDAPAPDNPRSHIQFVDASWTGSPAAYPLAPTQVARGESCTVAGEQRTGFVASPALALATAFWRACQKTPAMRTCPTRPAGPLRTGLVAPASTAAAPIEGIVPRTLPAGATAPMAIRWGYRLTDTMKAYHRDSADLDACASQFVDHGVWTPLWTYLELAVLPAAWRSDRGTGARCAYIDAVSAAALYDPRRFAGGGGGDPDDVATKFIANRVVLLGGSVSLTGDVFESPVNGPLPGVFNHAAAVENLISDEDEYKVAEPGWPQKIALGLLAACLVAAMAWLWQRLRRTLNRLAGPIGVHLLAPAAYMLILPLVAIPLIVFLTWKTRFALTDIAMPIVALHLILFSDMVSNWRLGVRRLIRRWVTPAPAPAAASPRPSRSKGRRPARRT